MGLLDRIRQALSGPQAQPDPNAPPVVYKLTSGSQIELGLNLAHLPDKCALKMLGSKRNEYVERSTTAVIFRDRNSKFPNSVRVELPSGEFVGWVLKDDSDLACKVVDRVRGQLPADVRHRPLRLHVSMRVEGEVGDDVADVDDAVIRIKDPVEGEQI